MPSLNDVLKESVRGDLNKKRTLFNNIAGRLEKEGVLNKINQRRQDHGLEPLKKGDVVSYLFDVFSGKNLSDIEELSSSEAFVNTIAKHLVEITGTHDYDTFSPKTLEILRNLPEDVRSSLEVADIGTARSAHIKRILEHPLVQGVKLSTLLRTNFQDISPKAINKEIRNEKHITRFNIVKQIPPGSFHVMFLKDVLKFVDKKRRGEAFKNATRALKEGGILLVGSERKYSKDLPPEPYIQHGPTLLKVYVKLGGEMHKVHPTQYLEFLKKGKFKTWDQYVGEASKQLNRFKVKSRKIK